MHVDNLHREIFHAECWEFRLLCNNYLHMYLMEFIQINSKVRGKSNSFWWCKRYSEIGSDSENVFRQDSWTLSR